MGCLTALLSHIEARERFRQDTKSIRGALSVASSYRSPVHCPVQNSVRILPSLHQALTISMVCIRHICTAEYSSLHRKTALTFFSQMFNFTFVDG
jgi:hypothetical protein